MTNHIIEGSRKRIVKDGAFQRKIARSLLHPDNLDKNRAPEKALSISLRSSRMICKNRKNRQNVARMCVSVYRWRVCNMSVRPVADDHTSGCHWARGPLSRLLGSLVGCFDGVRSAVRLRRAVGPVGLAEVVERGTEVELDAIEAKFMEGGELAVLELIGDVLAREEPKYVIDGGRWLTLSDGSPIGTVMTPTGAMEIEKLRCDVPQLLGRRVFLFSSSLVFSVWVVRLVCTIHPERPLNRMADPLDGGCKRAILYLVKNTKF